MQEETTSTPSSFTGNVLGDLGVTASMPQTRTISIQNEYVIQIDPCEGGYYWQLFWNDQRINGGLETSPERALGTAQHALYNHHRGIERGDERESER
jgi:hypothetical protein